MKTLAQMRKTKRQLRREERREMNEYRTSRSRVTGFDIEGGSTGVVATVIRRGMYQFPGTEEIEFVNTQWYHNATASSVLRLVRMARKDGYEIG